MLLTRLRGWLKKFWWIPALLLVLLGAGLGYALSKREGLFREKLEAVLASQRNKGLEIRIGGSGFAGLSSVRFRDVSVIPAGRDTLLRLEECLVDIKIWPLLFGRVQLDDLTMNNGVLHLVRRDSLSNIDFLLRKKTGDTSAAGTPEGPGAVEKPAADLAALANRLITQALYKVPDDMEVRNFRLKIDDDSLKAQVLAEEIRMNNKKLRSTFILNDGEAVWHLSGRVDAADRQLALRLYADDRKFEMPYLYDRYRLRLRFDDIETTMKDIRYDRNKGELVIEGSWAVNGMVLNHPAIATNDIVIESASMDAVMRFGRNWISLDSASTVHMGAIRFHPFLRYTLRPEKIYEIALRSEDMDAQDFFDSFPRGLFQTLEGMQVRGRLGYHLNFRLNDSIPDSVVFSSGLDQNGFEIVRFGKVDFRRINQPFVHTPYDDGKALTSFTVGPSNPDYTPYDQISDYVKDAVNTAEDGDFFGHQGFNEEAFRKSIALNYKTREFERGGSTISMQLVKNVFLDREKTVARKLEELMIVWLIEHEHLVSKRRMFEVYLNVIEWGPDLYGIGKAARFYFSKPPSELSLAESIYLASIVPSPSKFASHWNGDGTIRSSRHWYYRLIRDIMLRRGMITEAEAADYFYGLRLTRPARAWVRNNPIESPETPDTTLVLPEGNWLLEGLPTLFRGTEETAPDTLQPLSEETGLDTAAPGKRELRRQERQRRREARRNNQE